MQKPSQFTILDSAHCHIESLVHKQHHKDYQHWYDPIQKRQYHEYKLYGWPNEKQLENYQFRKDQNSNLVYIHYLEKIENSGFKQFKVFVEKVPLLLSSIQKLSLAQAIYTTRQSLIGFKALFEKFGYVHLDHKLIGFTPQGQVRVWLNETFAYNGDTQTHAAPKWMNENLRSRQMISSLFSIIQDRLDKNSTYRQFKKERELKLTNLTFDNAIDFIKKYVQINQISIPKALPQLLKWKMSDAFRKRWIKNQEKILQPLTFKKMSGSPKKKFENRIKLTITLADDNEKQKGAGTSRLLIGSGARLLSPSASSANGKFGIRPRNHSQAAISIAESRARTCQTTIRFKKSTTKYFYDKTRDEFLNNENGTLQSSLISRDFDFRNNNHFRNSRNKVQLFQFTQVQNQKSKPNHKKRKFSGADCVTFYANSAPQKQTNQNNNNLSLARSMVVKNKLENSNRFERNPETKIDNLESSKPFYDMEGLVRDSRASFGRGPSPARDVLQAHQVSYKVDKPFLNYKPIKSSFISNAKVDLKESTTSLLDPTNLKNSFLKNAQMKSSQIIMQRSSQYASIKDIMKTIKQSQIQTPMSQANFHGFGVLHQKQMSMFTGSPQKRQVSEHNVSNSTTDRKSSFYSEKKEGLLNFTSPKNTVKSGMFKSIIIQDPKQDITQVVEVQQQ